MFHVYHWQNRGLAVGKCFWTKIIGKDPMLTLCCSHVQSVFHFDFQRMTRIRLLTESCTNPSREINLMLLLHFLLKQENGHILKNKPKIQNLRVLSFRQRYKFKKVDWRYFFDFWPIFRDMTILWFLTKLRIQVQISKNGQGGPKTFFCKIKLR